MKYVLFIMLLSLAMITAMGQRIDNTLQKINPVAGAPASHTTLRTTGLEVCDNHIDDDNNGLIDEDDFDCYFASASRTSCKASNMLWACTSAGDLCWTNLATGTEKKVAHLLTPLLDLAWASDGKLYGMNFGIWEIDPYNGNMILKGPLPNGYLGANAMTADGLGNLYLTVFEPLVIPKYYVIKLNLATWTTCVVADLQGTGLFSAGDLTFLDGNLYLSCGSVSGNKIAKINLQNGGIEPITVIHPSTGGYFGLCAGGNGTLYATDGNEVYRIDPRNMESAPAPLFTFASPSDVNGLAGYPERCNGPVCDAVIHIEPSEEGPYCQNITLTLQVSKSCNAGAGIVNWKTPDGATLQGASITTTNPGMYYVTYHSPVANCTLVDSFLFERTFAPCDAAVFVPNAFTPNGDGLNDLFKPSVLQAVTKYEFIIFNRWGQMIFKTNSITQGWDGMLNGHQQSAGIFTWTCQYLDRRKKIQRQKGTVVLIR